MGAFPCDSATLSDLRPRGVGQQGAPWRSSVVFTKGPHLVEMIDLQSLIAHGADRIERIAFFSSRSTFPEFSGDQEPALFNIGPAYECVQRDDENLERTQDGSMAAFVLMCSLPRYSTSQERS